MSVNDKSVALGLAPSFGFGDRMGLATPGHLASLLAEGGPIRGIFAQQSIREMSRTKRSPDNVITAASKALVAEGYDQPWGSDADHLKTPEDVEYTIDSGFVFFTIDPSDNVDQKADNYDAQTIAAKYAQIQNETKWVTQYIGKTHTLANGTKLVFDEQAVQRAAVKYGKAITHAQNLADYIKHAAEVRGEDHEIELSVDETQQPTTLVEHYIIAQQIINHGVKLVSLAPRFIGELEKGVDYKGDLTALEASLADHAAIARELGPYKLSLHSGSDKLSMYTLFARATQGLFHVKTAGTSYLEALRVVARHDEKLFRTIIDFSRARYETDKATYHVSATLAGSPEAKDVSDIHELEGLYLEHWDAPGTFRTPRTPGAGFTAPGRQILHCTFGSVLTDPTLGKAVHDLVAAEPGTFKEVLALHFGKHLIALRAGM
ncbi:MAG: hypothetical protein JKX85_07230 [Phycisphaeraceae bacterium]|nr:hypothetical protein [Phycisphaeraceae bacterium]